MSGSSSTTRITSPMAAPLPPIEGARRRTGCRPTGARVATIARVRAASLVLVLAAVAIAAPAPAQDRSEDIHLAYAATPGGPTAEGFESLVVARTARARFTAAGEATRVFDVRLSVGKPAS